MPYKDPERKRTYQREWVSRNIERHREHSRRGMRKWMVANPEIHAARRDAYKRANPERVKVWTRRYEHSHPEVRLAIRQRRRARLLGATGDFTRAEWEDLVAVHDGCCAYCGSHSKLQPDHRIPLMRGGPNSIDNILPACGICNRRKGSMSEEEFRRRKADPRA